MGNQFHPPVTLEGTRLRLVPLAIEHAETLVSVSSDPVVFEFLSYGPFSDLPALQDHVRELFRKQALGHDLAFTVVRKSDGRPVGMTRFLNIERENNGVEIGGTWFDRRFWRGPFNTEAKRLLLGYAFEEEGAHRVQLQTDLRNERSQRAIERIGCRREGILREHRIVQHGYRRSSVVYSMLRPEWRDAKARLDSWIARPWVDPVATGAA